MNYKVNVKVMVIANVKQVLMEMLVTKKTKKKKKLFIVKIIVQDMEYAMMLWLVVDALKIILERIARNKIQN